MSILACGKGMVSIIVIVETIKRLVLGVVPINKRIDGRAVGLVGGWRVRVGCWFGSLASVKEKEKDRKRWGGQVGSRWVLCVLAVWWGTLLRKCEGKNYFRSVRKAGGMFVWMKSGTVSCWIG